MPSAFAARFAPRNFDFVSQPECSGAFPARHYLYEGYTDEARARYRQRDLPMRVVRAAAGGPAFTGFPGGMKLTF